MKFRTFCLLLVGICTIGLLLRIIGLSRVPPGVSSDVLLYFINARAIAETGKDIYGNILPVFATHKGFLVSPVTMYLIALVYKIAGFSFIAGYFPNIMSAVASTALSAFLATYLSGSRRIGILTAILMTISPWHYHLSRTGFEGVFAWGLVLVGILYSIRALNKPKLLLVSILFFSIATFTYKAVNVFLIIYPLVFIGTYASQKLRLKHSMLYTVSIWAIIAIQWFIMFVFVHDTYATGFIANHIQRASREVSTERVQSDAPRVLRLLASNIPITLSRNLFTNYIHFFSPQYLLTMGDTDSRYSTGGMGQLYILDMVLITFGIIWLYTIGKKKELVFLLGIILAAPLASLISDEQYAIRTLISVVALMILAASGLEFILNIRNKWKMGIIGLVIVWYGCSFALYLYRYHYLYIHYSREKWDGVNNEVFSEAYRLKNTYKRITFGRSSEFDYMAFIYWNRLNIATLQKELSSYDDVTLRFENISFIRSCSASGDQITLESFDKNELLYTPDACLKEIEPLKRYYLPKLLIWRWKTYDYKTIKSSLGIEESQTQ